MARYNRGGGLAGVVPTDEDGVPLSLATSADLAGASTATQSNVSGAASSTSLLAANTARKGATIWNDSSAILYVLLGTGTASATVCTVKLIADAYYEVPAGYTGAIKGIWASATGAARITELT
ncbi:MAG: hypothetical protein ACOY4K_00550 [Pseudomonadota bacterium]